MYKRRRASSVASRGVDEDESDSQQTPEPSRKKKKMDPMDVAQQLYDTIRSQKKEDGSLLCDSFIRAPKRRQQPAYYDLVSNPIDLLKVQQKLKTDEYEDVDDLVSDLELLVTNTKSFYKRNCVEYKDACELWELVQTTKAKLMEEAKPEEEPVRTTKRGRKGAPVTVEVKKEREDTEDTSESSSLTNDDELNMCEELFTAIMSATSEDNRPLHLAFQLLPSKKRYPNYYEVIENPIDLRMIANKIQRNKYNNLAEMEKDLVTMTKNACTFNEPGSVIYKDAKALRKVTQQKRQEIEQGKSPGKPSDRASRSKRLRGGQTLSAITAALKAEDDDEEEEGAMGDGEEDNPCWGLFATVKNATNNQGQVMSEPFIKLPSKKVYPDYYEEIRNPVSLLQINKKLQRGHYGTVSEVAGDLNIMFENAKKYNRPDSKLYKDAVKLQKLMQKKFQELLEVDKEYCESEEEGSSGGGTSEEGPPAARKTPKPLTPSTSKLLTRGKYLDNIPLKKRLYSLCKCLMTYVCADGRQPMLMFMEKPSIKLYPDYYEVIENPIDMLTIQANIKAEKYTSEEEILADFKVMFRNCRKYNEVGSMIYDDAMKLEKILMEKSKELGPLPPPEKSPPKPTVSMVVKKKGTAAAACVSAASPSGVSPVVSRPADHNLSRKLRILFHSVRDYRDTKSRQLSQIFMRLPSKVEYPDYYEVIKKPINLEQISQKVKSGWYDSLEGLCNELILMFDNACKYNEPDSQIYKDALTLQRVAMQTRLQLRQDEAGVPDVPAAVHELLTSLFTSVYNHQDEEGRCFSDSMQELPEHDDLDGNRVRGLSLDLIKRRLDSLQYKRLDHFQEEMFACLLRARNLSRTDSQVFEDSVELQSFFIRQRDELCKNGDVLASPALNYSLLDLSTAVDQQRQLKQTQEQPEPDDAEIKMEKDEVSGCVSMAGVADNALSYNQQVYRIGDFIYADGKEKGMEPIILNIQRLWTNQEGQQMLFGNQYYRPNETYHVTTRKFLEKEVFKTEQNVAIPLNQVQGRCCVLSVKDYFRYKPEGVDDKDVYVCESRYTARARAFKKIKNWPTSLTTGYKLVPREEVLEPKRVMSVFRQRVEKHKEEIAELEEQEKVSIKERPNVVVQVEGGADGWTYYEQFNCPSQIVVRTGDCVYMKTDSGRQLIAQVDSIWTNKEGAGFFRGPWVVLPTELPPSLPKNCFKQEVYLSTLEDTHTVTNVLGKCAVLEHHDYVSCRPTEVPEKDVFLCENMYDEAKRAIRELPKEGLKKYAHCAQVTQDEIYYFKRILNLRHQAMHKQVQEVSNPNPAPSISNQFENSVDSDVIMEDSMDSCTNFPSDSSSKLLSKVKTAGGKKLVTGYMLYSGDIRKSMTAANPDKNSGEISRLVGNEWRKLPSSEKAVWEEKATRLNEAAAAEAGEREREGGKSPVPPPTEVVFECCWHDCDWQFEDVADAIDHACNDPIGHVYQFFALIPPTEAEYQCHWRGCCRTTKKTIPPFPNLHRLARHVREVHLLKSTGRTIVSDQRSKHYLSSRKAAAAALAAANAVKNPPVPGLVVSVGPGQPPPPIHNGVPSMNNGGRPYEPLFVTVPPRPQKLLHSEAYIKYIEGLSAENRNVSSWEKQLRASCLTVDQVEKGRLPGHWLAHGIGNHGTILNALWTLRDFMFKDALGISKHL